MVFFSALMHYAYTWKEYKRKEGTPPTSIWRPLWDSINLCKSRPCTLQLRGPSDDSLADFALETWGSLVFFVDYMQGKPTAHGHGHRVQSDFHGNTKMDFGEAFGVVPRRSFRASEGLIQNPGAPLQSETIPLTAYPMSRQTFEKQQVA